MKKSKDIEVTDHTAEANDPTYWRDKGGIYNPVADCWDPPAKDLNTPPASPPAFVDSASDARTQNNVMRHEYRILSEGEKEQMKTIKDEGARFFEYCDRIGQSRELSLAKTKIEEAVMWAVKHVTK